MTISLVKLCLTLETSVKLFPCRRSFDEPKEMLDNEVSL